MCLLDSPEVLIPGHRHSISHNLPIIESIQIFYNIFILKTFNMTEVAFIIIKRIPGIMGESDHTWYSGAKPDSKS